MSKKKISSIPKKDVSLINSEFQKELNYLLEENVQWIPRKDNGTNKDVESYWMYFKDRRFLRFDIYHSLSSEEAYGKTKEYLYWITEKQYSMTPFLGYITKDSGVELFLYRRGPSVSPIDIQHFASLIWSFYRQTENALIKKRNRSLKEYVDGLHTIIRDSPNLLLEQKQKLMEVFSMDSLDFSEESDIVSLKPAFERELYKSLLPQQGEQNFSSLCRYTSVNSLFRILSERKISMLSIVCMNDTSECSYVKDYLSRRGCNVLENTWKENNRYYIISCTDINEADDLMMWNMYGGKAEGVCITYSFDPNTISVETGFSLARISYGEDKDKHAALDFIVEILLSSVSGKKLSLQLLDTWQHFFKSHEYHKENEIRLLFESDADHGTKWLMTNDNLLTPMQEFSISAKRNVGLPSFPLQMRSIIIGPKCKNAETLLSQLQAMLAIHESQDVDCFVLPSTIDSFR